MCIVLLPWLLMIKATLPCLFSFGPCNNISITQLRKANDLYWERLIEVTTEEHKTNVLKTESIISRCFCSPDCSAWHLIKILTLRSDDIYSSANPDSNKQLREAWSCWLKYFQFRWFTLLVMRPSSTHHLISWVVQNACVSTLNNCKTHEC